MDGSRVRGGLGLISFASPYDFLQQHDDCDFLIPPAGGTADDHQFPRSSTNSITSTSKRQCHPGPQCSHDLHQPPTSRRRCMRCTREVCEGRRPTTIVSRSCAVIETRLLGYCDNAVVSEAVVANRDLLEDHMRRSKRSSRHLLHQYDRPGIRGTLTVWEKLKVMVSNVDLHKCMRKLAQRSSKRSPLSES